MIHFEEAKRRRFASFSNPPNVRIEAQINNYILLSTLQLCRNAKIRSLIAQHIKINTGQLLVGASGGNNARNEEINMLVLEKCGVGHATRKSISAKR